MNIVPSPRHRKTALLAGGIAVTVTMLVVTALVLARDDDSAVLSPRPSPTALPESYAPEDGAYRVESDICDAAGESAIELGGQEGTAEHLVEGPDWFRAECDFGALRVRAAVHGSKVPAAGVWSTVSDTARASQGFEEIASDFGDFDQALLYRATPSYDGDSDEISLLASRDNLYISVGFALDGSDAESASTSLRTIATTVDGALRK